METSEILTLLDDFIKTHRRYELAEIKEFEKEQDEFLRNLNLNTAKQWGFAKHSLIMLKNRIEEAAE